jgi:hypothetical protein
MPFTTAPFPTKDPLVNPNRKFVATQELIDWATNLAGDVDASPARLKTVPLTQQSASIGTTTIPTGALGGGLYRVSWYARITTPGSVSSSLTITIGWTEGVTLSASGAAMTGNTTGTVQSGSMLIRIDGSSPITYSTVYASAGATAMQYRLDVVLEQVEA